MTAARNLLFILIILASLLAGCGDDNERDVARPPDEVEQELSRFSLVRMLDGRMNWKLNADAATFMESDEVSIEGVELLIFGNKEGEVTTVRGDRGEVNQRTNNMVITGNVVGISSEGGRLETEEIHWRDMTGKLYTLPGVKVTIIYEDSVIVGDELEADPNLETAKLKNMTGVTRSEEKKSENSKN